jgi:hypothetical protein
VVSRRVFAGVAVVALVGIGLLIGRAIALSPTQALEPAPTRNDEPQATAPPPTPEEAITAATRIVYSFDLPTVLDEDRFRAAVRRVAAPGRRREVSNLFGQGIDAIRAMFAQEPRVARAAPVGYRLLSFRQHAASVAIWNVSIGGSPQVAPTAQWRTIALDLKYTQEGWKATGGGAMAGPSPELRIRQLAAQARRFKAFRYAP